MWGNDDIIKEELHGGTTKSMEGVLADQCYQQAKLEGCKVNTVWQDGDSKSTNAVSLHHTTAAQVYKCGEQLGKAHNTLKE